MMNCIGYKISILFLLRLPIGATYFFVGTIILVIFFFVKTPISAIVKLLLKGLLNLLDSLLLFYSTWSCSLFHLSLDFWREVFFLIVKKW